MNSPKVSVSITAFNHAPFLRQALDGVLAQETPFGVEILVGDDDSTDGTREIVRDYEARYPERVRAFYHEASGKLRIKGRLTGRKNLANNLNSARGEFIALLDGDDFWTDPTKLARQVEQLEQDATLMTSFHEVAFVNEHGKIIEQPVPEQRPAGRCTLADLISGARVAQTGSVLFRRGAIHPLPAWYFETPVGDFPLHVMNGQRGDFGYIDRCMGAYRVHQGGVWSGGRTEEDWNDRSLKQARASLTRFEILVDLMATVAAQCAPRFQLVARQRLAFFAYEAAHQAGKLQDKPALRRNLWRLVRHHPWPRHLRWRVLGRLLRKAL